MASTFTTFSFHCLYIHCHPCFFYNPCRKRAIETVTRLEERKPNKILKASYNPPPPPPPKKIPRPKNIPQKIPSRVSEPRKTTPNIAAAPTMLRPCCSGMETVEQLPTTRNNMKQGEKT